MQVAIRNGFLADVAQCAPTRFAQVDNIVRLRMYQYAACQQVPVFVRRPKQYSSYKVLVSRNSE